MGLGLWRDRDFRSFWFGETISTAGSAMAVVAMPLTAVLVLHSSTLVVGLLQATAWLPAVLIGLPAGAWVDRRRKRPVMLACDVAAFALFASVPIAAWAGVLTIGQLVAVAFLAGSAAVFFSASYGPFLRSVVRPEHRLEANAKLEGSVWAAQMAGPGLGGLAAQLLGAVSGLFANALSFLVSAACLTRIRVAEPAPKPRAEHASLRAEISEGIRFVVRDPRLRVVTAYMGAGNFGDSMVEAVVIVFLVRTVKVGPGLAGILVATQPATSSPPSVASMIMGRNGRYLPKSTHDHGAGRVGWGGGAGVGMLRRVRTPISTAAQVIAASARLKVHGKCGRFSQSTTLPRNGPGARNRRSARFPAAPPSSSPRAMVQARLRSRAATRMT